MAYKAISGRHAGRSAFVTGGGSGLGEAICKRLAAEGALVAVVDRDLGAAARVTAEIQSFGGTALSVQADVTDYVAVETAIERTCKAFGRLDLAVNNAGIGPAFMPTAEQSLASWQEVIGVNLTGVFHCMKAQLPHLVSRGGAIINIASVTALVGCAGISSYVAAKHGVLGLTKSAALEYGPLGVRVTAVCPTFVKTPMTQATLQHDQDWAGLDAMHALKRCATPEDVAAMVAFLGSDDGTMLTGCAYPVDGGYSTS